MPVIHVNEKASPVLMNNMNEHIDSGKPAFVLLYMNGCGPCGETRPKWMELEKKFSSNGDIGIFDVEMSKLDSIANPRLKENVAGFPTIRYIKNDVCEDYEKCDDITHDRSYASFMDWIKKKEGNSYSLQGGARSRKAKKAKKAKKTKKAKNAKKAKKATPTRYRSRSRSDTKRKRGRRGVRSTYKRRGRATRRKKRYGMRTKTRRGGDADRETRSEAEASDAEGVVLDSIMEGATLA